VEFFNVQPVGMYSNYQDFTG